jgi:hypothetical protein
MSKISNIAIREHLKLGSEKPRYFTTSGFMVHTSLFCHDYVGDKWERRDISGLGQETRLFLQRFSSNHFDAIMEMALIPPIIATAISNTSMAYFPKVAPDSSIKNFLIHSMALFPLLQFGFAFGLAQLMSI